VRLYLLLALVIGLSGGAADGHTRSTSGLPESATAALNFFASAA
jgi:hypothetical protein